MIQRCAAPRRADKQWTKQINVAACFETASRAYDGVISRPYLSTLQPQCEQVEPPHRNSCIEVGLRIARKRVPQRGQLVPPTEPRPQRPLAFVCCQMNAPSAPSATMMTTASISIPPTIAESRAHGAENLAAALEPGTMTGRALRRRTAAVQRAFPGGRRSRRPAPGRR